jgi:hypothetical protein
MPVLRYTGARGMNQHRQFLCTQIVKRALDRSLVVADNRIAVRGLIARSGEANQGERVVFRRCPFLFKETTEDTRFDWRKIQRHRVLLVVLLVVVGGVMVMVLQ